MNKILAILSTVSNVDILAGNGTIIEILTFGDVASATVSAIFGQFSAYVIDVTGNGGYIYNVNGNKVVVYFN